MTRPPGNGTEWGHDQRGAEPPRLVVPRGRGWLRGTGDSRPELVKVAGQSDPTGWCYVTLLIGTPPAGQGSDSGYGLARPSCVRANARANARVRRADGRGSSTGLEALLPLCCRAWLCSAPSSLFPSSLLYGSLLRRRGALERPVPGTWSRLARDPSPLVVVPEVLSQDAPLSS